MKKIFLTLCLTLAALNTFAGGRDSLMIGNPLLLLFDGYTYPLPGHGRGPICPPSASIDGYTLYFWDTCDFTIYIKEEEENGDEQVVYTTFVPASMTSTILPNNLFGSYIIEVVRDNQCFIGEIEL